VVYNPEYKKYENYVPTDLTRRYDAFLHMDKTHALHPLHMAEVKKKIFLRLSLVDCNGL
jgi:erythromycin esterase